MELKELENKVCLFAVKYSVVYYIFGFLVLQLCLAFCEQRILDNKYKRSLWINHFNVILSVLVQREGSYPNYG